MAVRLSSPGYELPVDPARLTEGIHAKQSSRVGQGEPAELAFKGCTSRAHLRSYL